MRFSTVGIVLASMLVASSALAAEGKGGSKGGSSGGGSSGSGDTSGGGANVTGNDLFSSETYREPDAITGEANRYKPWEVGGIFETHRLVRQDDLAGGDAVPGSPDSGAANNKFLNTLELYARYDLTEHDRIGLLGFFYQRFLADSGETGFRVDDLVGTYTHLFRLPEKFRLQMSGWLTAPTSYDSQLMGLITAPRITAEVDRWFGTLNLDFRAYDQYYVQKYTSYAGSGGAVATPENTIAVAFDAEYHMPFHTPLSVGLGLYTAWTWYHNINTGDTGQTTQGQNGVVADPTFSTQPIQQTYGGEVFARYLLPPFAGIKSDFSLAYAMGDGSVGYTSVLHEGVGHAYLGYRQNSEVYASLAVRY